MAKRRCRPVRADSCSRATAKIRSRRAESPARLRRKMWPSFSLCACRILKMRSCLRRPLAPGRSKVLAILVSSVMFFSFNSAMVMIHLNPCTRAIFGSVNGRFSKGGDSGKTQVLRGRKAGLVKQPAVAPQQNSLVPTKLPAAVSLRSDPTRRSSFPGFWCWAGGTSAWPWRQADTAYNGSAESVKHQTHDQIACVLSLLAL